MKDFFQKNIGLILGVVGGIAALIVILQFLIAPINTRFELVDQRLTHIENQVNNHIPTQIRELRSEMQAMNQRFDQMNQRFDQMSQRFDQKFEQMNQRLDRLFERETENRK